MAISLIETFEQQGFAITRSAIDEVARKRIVERLAEFSGVEAGTRNLLQHEWCKQLAAQLAPDRRVSGLMADKIAVQCTLFAKAPDHAWRVPYHQDLSIPARGKVDEVGGGSAKEGVPYVQPPKAVLAALLAVRIHLDDCGHNNGPLRVITGSHRRGRIAESDIAMIVAQGEEVVCAVNAGDVLVMHPLLLHASSKPSVPSRRRVLHFLYGPAVLPSGLQWHEWCPQTNPS